MAGRTASATTRATVSADAIYPKDWPRIDEKLSKPASFIVFGEEHFAAEDFIHLAVAKLKKVAHKTFSSVTVKYHHAADPAFDMNEFLAGESTMGLFGNEDFTVEVVRGLDELGATSKETKKFCAFLSSLHREGEEEGARAVVAVYGSKTLPAEYAKIAKGFVVVQCKKLYEGDVASYARTLAARSGKHFTDDALAELVDRSRMNLFQIASETRRLAILHHDKAEIDRETVEASVEHFFDPESFQATNELDYAIYHKDIPSAVKVINELIDKGFYYSLIVMRLMSIFRAMLSAKLLAEASAKFAQGAFRIAAEYSDGMARKSGYQRFAFANEMAAKLESFCRALAEAEGIFIAESKYDILNGLRNQMTMHAIHYSKKYSEESLFALMDDLYNIDVKVRTGLLRIDQRPESVKEEILRILSVNCS